MIDQFAQYLDGLVHYNVSGSHTWPKSFASEGDCSNTPRDIDPLASHMKVVRRHLDKGKCHHPKVNDNNNLYCVLYKDVATPVTCVRETDSPTSSWRLAQRTPPADHNERVSSYMFGLFPTRKYIQEIS